MKHFFEFMNTGTVSKFLSRTGVIWFCFLLWELILRAAVALHGYVDDYAVTTFFSGSLVRIVLITLPLALFISAIVTICGKRRLRGWVGITLMTVIALAFMSQLINFSVFQTYWVINSLGQATELSDFYATILTNTISNIHWFTGIILVLVIYILFELKIIKSIEMTSLSQVSAIVLAVVMTSTAAWIGFIPAVRDPSSTMGVFFGKNEYNVNALFNNSGFLGAFGVQLADIIFERGAVGDVDDIEWPIVSETPEETQPPLPPREPYAIIDIDYDDVHQVTVFWNEYHHGDGRYLRQGEEFIVENGSIVITLTLNFIENLSERVYTFKVSFLDESGSDVEDSVLLNLTIITSGTSEAGNSSDDRVSQDFGTVNPEGDPAPLPEPPTYNMFDIPFDVLASNTTNARLRQVHEFFGSRPPSRQNHMTGIFEDYNLIFITAEAWSDFAVRPDTTPTLYHMMHNGIHFRNFYNPSWNVSTLDGEFVNLLGMFPTPGVWSLYRTGRDNVWLPFNFAQQFSNLFNDSPRAYHNWTWNFYRRHISHPRLGYAWSARNGSANGGTTLRFSPDMWPNSDNAMMRKTVDNWIDRAENGNPFHVYYLTVSGHREFTFGGNNMARRHRSATNHLIPYGYTEGARAYLSSQIELELAVAYLMERLEDAGIAERTLIVIASDHKPYGLTHAEIAHLSGRPVANAHRDAMELRRSGAIVYARGMDPVTVDRPMSNVDLLPTVSNLLGLPFDSRMMMGIDAFGNQPSLVVFNNGSFITDNGRFNRHNNTFVQTSNRELPSDYRQRVSQIVSAKRTISTAVRELDYFRRIEDYLMPYFASRT